MGVHTGCQAVSQHCTSLADCPWGGVHSCSFPSGSAPVLPTSHCSLERDLGWTGPGRALPQRQPRSHAAAQPPLFLQPQCPGLQRQPSSRPQKNTTEKGASPWAASGQNRGCIRRLCIGLLWPHQPHSLQNSPPWGQSTHLRATESYQTWPSGLLLQQPGSRPHPQQGYDSHRAKRKTHPTSSAGSGHHNTNHTPYQGDTNQNTLRKDVAGIQTKYSRHTKNTVLTQFTKGHSHIKTALWDHDR